MRSKCDRHGLGDSRNSSGVHSAPYLSTSIQGFRDRAKDGSPGWPRASSQDSQTHFGPGVLQFGTTLHFIHFKFLFKKKCNHGWKSCRVCSFQDVTTKRKLWPYPNQFPKQESVSSRHSDQTASQSRMCIIKVALTHGVLQNFPAALVPSATPTLRTAHVSRHARPAKAA